MSSFKNRYKLAPQMRDYDVLGSAWLPYVMYFQQPNFQSSSVNTDRHGFRFSCDRAGEPLSLDTLKDREFNVLVGGSTAFGVGASSDAETISGHLSRSSGENWLNFGGRAYNSAQELYLSMNHLGRTAPGKIKKIVLFSGVNNLVLHYILRGQIDPYIGFFNQQIFFNAMSDASLSLLRRFARAVLTPIYGDKIDYARVSKKDLIAHITHVKKLEKVDVEVEFLAHVNARALLREEVINTWIRDLGFWRMWADKLGAELHFVLQPMFNWVGKNMCQNETLIFPELDAVQKSQFQILKDVINLELYEWYREVMRNACETTAVPFADINPYFTERAKHDDWLFVDRAHLTNTGNLWATEFILDRLKK